MGRRRAAHREQEMEGMLALMDSAVASAGERPAVVLCGDWNERAGGVSCMVEASHVGCEQGFKSAYEQNPPMYTAQDFTADWCSGVERSVIPGIPVGAYQDDIDFIFYSVADLCVQQTWREPEFSSTLPTGIPHTKYPSDHVALACELGWAQTATARIPAAQAEDEHSAVVVMRGLPYHVTSVLLAFLLALRWLLHS
jgi:endonuclease/exonuclease/phosphatase family metal-dependent hydrolase